MAKQTLSDYLFIKAIEEMGEAQQAIAKLLLHGPDAKWDDGTNNLKKVAQELGDVSTFIALILDTEQVKPKDFWDGFEAKSKKIEKKLQKMADAEEDKEEDKPTDDNSK